MSSLGYSRRQEKNPIFSENGKIPPANMTGKSGILLSTTALVILGVTVVVVLVVEGLLIGLVGRPECDANSIVITEAPPTTKGVTQSLSDTTTVQIGPAGPWQNIRLPKSLIPTEYVVDLRPILDSKDEHGRYIFWGSSTVTYVCMEPTEYIIMHSIKLNYTQANVKVTSDNQNIAIAKFFFHSPNEFVVVETEVACIKGRHYQLTVTDFVAELSDDLNGLYRSEYDTSDGTHKIIATSQMEATGARETFPCFDEPALKANFTVTLWYKANTGEFALSNMPPSSYMARSINGELWNSTTFKESVPMSTYLLALVVCDFSHLETFSDSDVQTRIYSRTETVDNGEAKYASEITPAILDFFEDYFSVAYPLPKSDQMAVPDFGAGAMENWGLIIYRETYLLYNVNVSSVFDKRRCTNVIAHELAHQWFGNLVSPAWWDDIWLNEGFASYVSYLGEAEVQPTWKTMERFLTDDLHYAFDVDALTSSHPLVQAVNSPSEISSQFDDISYSKGSSILRMINDFMGEQNFVDGLTNYLNDLAYGSATHGDLFQHWEDQSETAGLEFPVKLTTILETWTLQMGFPVVNVFKQGVSYEVTQEYFLLDPSAVPVETPGSTIYEYKWYIPFTYQNPSQIGTDSMTRDWLVPDTEKNIVETNYILANIDAKGYYRVNYDTGTWSNLIEKLKSPLFKDISEENRAQLLDDAFNLARPGRLDITVAMDLSTYLTAEEEYVPWKTFTENIKFIEYMLGRTQAYGTLSNYILQLIEPTLYQKYGWDEPNLDDTAQIERMTIQLAIDSSCYYGSSDCIQKAKELYRMWMANPNDNSIISNTYRDDVYCAAIRNGGVKEWNFAWERHNASTNAQEQSSLRYGMACSKEPWILNRYMEYCIDTSLIRKQDSLRTCLQYIGAEEYGRDLAWSFLVLNWDMLVEKYGSGISFDNLIEIITRRFSTDYDLEMLQDFKDTNENLGTAARAVDQAIERTKVNIKWRELNEEPLIQWLNKNVQDIV